VGKLLLEDVKKFGRLIHGEEEALNAQKTAEALFEKGASTDNMPTTEVASGELSNGIKHN